MESDVQSFACSPHLGNHRGACSLVSATTRAGRLPRDHSIFLSYLRDSHALSCVSCQNPQSQTCGPLSRRLECMMGMHSVCWLQCWVCLFFIYHKYACHSPYLRRKDLGKNWSPVRQFYPFAIVLPHSCQDGCSTESVWGCHVSAQHYPPAAQDTERWAGIEARVWELHEPSFQFQIWPCMPWEGDLTSLCLSFLIIKQAGTSTLNPLASSPPACVAEVSLWYFLHPNLSFPSPLYIFTISSLPQICLSHFSHQKRLLLLKKKKKKFKPFKCSFAFSIRLTFYPSLPFL